MGVFIRLAAIGLIIGLCLSGLAACSGGGVAVGVGWGCLSGGASTYYCSDCCSTCQVNYYGAGIHRCW